MSIKLKLPIKFGVNEINKFKFKFFPNIYDDDEIEEVDIRSMLLIRDDEDLTDFSDMVADEDDNEYITYGQHDSYVYIGPFKIHIGYSMTFTYHEDHITLDEIERDDKIYYQLENMLLATHNIKKWEYVKIPNSLCFTKDDSEPARGVAKILVQMDGSYTQGYYNYDYSDEQMIALVKTLNENSKDMCRETVQGGGMEYFTKHLGIICSSYCPFDAKLICSTMHIQHEP